MKQKPINTKNENEDYEEIMKEIKTWTSSWNKHYVLEKLIENRYIKSQFYMS